jgi:signal transduction histidine kinase
VDDSEISLFPTGTVEQIAVRTLIPVGLISLLLAFFAFRAGGRMADDALKPVSALRKAFNATASGDLTPYYVAETGADELGSLIATYNCSVETAERLRLERDAAEARTHQFIADAGHQLRTPLTVLGGFISILRSGQLRHEDDGPKILRKMDQQIEIMKNLVEKMMVLESWHCADSPICEVADIGEFVTGVVDPIAGSHPEIAIRLSTITGPSACIDPAELTYAISNLVENAIKYAPDGVIVVDVKADESTIYIAIEDQGPGIAPDVLPHIFDRFYRGSRRDVAGSGLGLAIAKGAVERAHGTLHAQSTLGKGTRFTIALPRWGVTSEGSTRDVLPLSGLQGAS